MNTPPTTDNENNGAATETADRKVNPVDPFAAFNQQNPLANHVIPLPKAPTMLPFDPKIIVYPFIHNAAAPNIPMAHQMNPSAVPSPDPTHTIIYSFPQNAAPNHNIPMTHQMNPSDAPPLDPRPNVYLLAQKHPHMLNPHEHQAHNPMGTSNGNIHPTTFSSPTTPGLHPDVPNGMTPHSSVMLPTGNDNSQLIQDHHIPSPNGHHGHNHPAPHSSATTSPHQEPHPTGTSGLIHPAMLSPPDTPDGLHGSHSNLNPDNPQHLHGHHMPTPNGHHQQVFTAPHSTMTHQQLHTTASSSDSHSPHISPKTTSTEATGPSHGHVHPAMLASPPVTGSHGSNPHMIALIPQNDLISHGPPLDNNNFQHLHSNNMPMPTGHHEHAPNNNQIHQSVHDVPVEYALPMPHHMSSHSQNSGMNLPPSDPFIGPQTHDLPSPDHPATVQNDHPTHIILIPHHVEPSMPHPNHAMPMHPPSHDAAHMIHPDPHSQIILIPHSPPPMPSDNSWPHQNDFQDNPAPRYPPTAMESSPVPTLDLPSKTLDGSTETFPKPDDHIPGLPHSNLPIGPHPIASDPIHLPVSPQAALAHHLAQFLRTTPN